MSAPQAPPPVLSAENLTLSRGGRTLFRDLSFAVPAAGVLLLRGPNGAGKTSLLLALAGAIRPEAGRVTCREPGEDGPLLPIHLLLTHNAIKPRLSTAENLAFWRAVNGRGSLGLEAALDRVGLGGLGMIEAGHLSTGQTRRLALARLIVSERPVWLLDEPATALDADGETLVRELVLAHCRSGGIAVVATHHELGLEAVDGGTTTLLIRDGKTELAA